MNFVSRRSRLRGAVDIPGSKSHTIRAVALASMAPGESTIREPLWSKDTRAALEAYGALGATIDAGERVWTVQGTGGEFRPPAATIDVQNSGTTLPFAMGACALLREGKATLDGDAQIRRRPCGPLAASLTDLGAKARAVHDNGCAPFEVEGRLTGGETTIECQTSQWLSALLLCTPLAEGDTVIHVPLLYEQPYAGMTLDWIARYGVSIEYSDYTEFRIRGGQAYQAFDRRIPADFSSGTFFLAAGALGDNAIDALGLDMNDSQGDKAVVGYLEQMGATIAVHEGGVRVSSNGLTGCRIDMNATPDALPMMAVVACFAKGTTELVNVPQARLKETDRIAVMKTELEKLGARVTELEDGLVIEESPLSGAVVEGHDDHRVVMSLALAGTLIDGDTVVRGSEAAGVTFPGFAEAVRGLGGVVEEIGT